MLDALSDADSVDDIVATDVAVAVLDPDALSESELLSVRDCVSSDVSVDESVDDTVLEALDEAVIDEVSGTVAEPVDVRERLNVAVSLTVAV